MPAGGRQREFVNLVCRRDILIGALDRKSIHDRLEKAWLHGITSSRIGRIAFRSSLFKRRIGRGCVLELFFEPQVLVKTYALD